MEVSTRTVQRCRAAARDLGLLVDVARGRMLSLEECLQARHQGSPQRGLSNESALVIPKWLGITAWQPRHSVDHVTPTSGRAQKHKNVPAAGGFPRRANGKTRLASSPRHQPKCHAGVAGHPDPQKWALHAQTAELARKLIATVPWLRQEQPGRIRPLLARFVRGPLPWVAEDILEHIDRTNAQRQQPAFTADRITTRPAVILADYLRGIDPQADHPRGHLIVQMEQADLDRNSATPDETAAARPTWCGN